MRELIVDTVPLRDPLGEWWVDYTRSLTMPTLSRAFSSDPPYGYHGNPATPATEEAFFGTAAETWVLSVTGTDKDDFNVNLRGLLLLFQRPELAVLSAPQRSALASSTARFGASFAGGVSVDAVQVARMRLKGDPVRDYVDEQTCRLTLILDNLGPFWSSNLYYTSAASTMSASPLTIPLDTTVSDSTAPIVDGLIRFKGPISAGGTMTVQDRGNPFRSITYKATVALASTEYVVVDIATLKARLNTTNVWTFTTGTDVSSRISTSGDGAFYLSPTMGSSFPAGPNSFTATAVGVGHTTATAVDFRLRRSYLA